MTPTEPLPTGTVTVSIIVILLVFAFLEHRLEGMQWPAFLLGGWLAAAAPAGSLIDDLWVSSLGVFQSVIVKGAEALGQIGA